MTDRIQELREEADAHESSCGVFRPDGRSTCSCRRRLMLEALDGWENAEADRDTYRAAWNRAEADLTQLREAARKVRPVPVTITYTGEAMIAPVDAHALAALCDLTQENPDDE